MRLLLPALLLFTSHLIAQCDYHTNQVDKFTKHRTLVTKFAKVNYPNLGGNKVSLALGKVTADSIDMYVVFIQVEDLDEMMCVNRNSKLYILTSDDETVEIMEIGGVKCSESSIGLFQFLISKDDLEILAGENITALRLQHTDGSMDINISGRDISKAVGVGYFKKYTHCIL